MKPSEGTGHSSAGPQNHCASKTTKFFLPNERSHSPRSALAEKDFRRA
jgi:hypothetical protein